MNNKKYEKINKKKREMRSVVGLQFQHEVVPSKMQSDSNLLFAAEEGRMSLMLLVAHGIITIVYPNGISTVNLRSVEFSASIKRQIECFFH